MSFIAKASPCSPGNIVHNMQGVSKKVTNRMQLEPKILTKIECHGTKFRH